MYFVSKVSRRFFLMQHFIPRFNILVSLCLKMYKSINSFNDEADGNDNLTHLPGVRTAKTNADAIIFKREIIFSVYITAYEGTI